MTDYLKHKIELGNSEFATVFDELTFWSSRFGRLLFDRIEIRAHRSILDVGCASGFPLFELANTFGRSCRITGLDIWGEALKRAGRKLKFYELPNVALVEADGAHQPFRADSFDLLVSNLGVNNWSDPELVLAECFRVAKARARLVLTTNVLGHYREFYDVFRETLRELKRPEELQKLDAQEEHRGTRESVCDLLQKTGWNPLRVVEDHFEMRFLDGSALLNHSLTKIGFLDGWRSVVAPDEELLVFAAVEKKLNERARREGELRMSVPMLYLEAEKVEGTKAGASPPS
jgi:ubiquinone/menaquinone biosynthesis C-methylase UbiE